MGLPASSSTIGLTFALRPNGTGALQNATILGFTYAVAFKSRRATTIRLMAAF